MRTLILNLMLALVLGAMLGSPAVADIDLAISDVAVEDAGGGLADVVVHVDLRVHGPASANTTDVTLVLDGLVHDTIWIDYSLYEAVGCTYYPNWNNLGPACVDEPGCDLWTIGGVMIPGNCVLVFAGEVPLACYCSHPWTVVFHNVHVAGIAMLQVFVDHAQGIAETFEDNNVMTIESPVGSRDETWGVIKGLYR